MPNTYTLIATSTPSSGTSVVFSSIPATYNDLKLVSSTRNARAANLDIMGFRFNGDTTTTNHKYVRLTADTNSVPSSTYGTETIQYSNGSTNTTNSFSTSEIYIPNYVSTTSNKIVYANTSTTSNETAGSTYLAFFAGLWLSTAAITSITIYSTNTQAFASGSSFYLYGIKNS